MKVSAGTWTQVAQACDGEPFFNYSGRWMYGAKCVGIVLSQNQVIGVQSAIEKYVESDEVKKALLADVRTDNMAFDVIVYFPNVSSEETPDER